MDKNIVKTGIYAKPNSPGCGAYVLRFDSLSIQSGHGLHSGSDTYANSETSHGLL